MSCRPPGALAGFPAAFHPPSHLFPLAMRCPGVTCRDAAFPPPCPLGSIPIAPGSVKSASGGGEPLNQGLPLLWVPYHFFLTVSKTTGAIGCKYRTILYFMCLGTSLTLLHPFQPLVLPLLCLSLCPVPVQQRFSPTSSENQLGLGLFCLNPMVSECTVSK